MDGDAASPAEPEETLNFFDQIDKRKRERRARQEADGRWPKYGPEWMRFDLEQQRLLALTAAATVIAGGVAAMVIYVALGVHHLDTTIQTKLTHRYSHFAKTHDYSDEVTVAFFALLILYVPTTRLRAGIGLAIQRRRAAKPKLDMRLDALVRLFNRLLVVGAVWWVVELIGSLVEGFRAQK